MTFDPTRSIFYGMDSAMLLAKRNEAQMAYADLASGLRGETYSYTQGEGQRSVTYTRANLTALRQLIMELNAMLGINSCPRRAIGARF